MQAQNNPFACSAKRGKATSFAKEPWERTSVSLGIAAYDPEIDKSVDDVVIHADHRMYQNKRRRKKEKR